MDETYTWRAVRKRRSSRPGLSAWVWSIVALCFALGLHLALLVSADRMSWTFGVSDDGVKETDWLSLQRVEIDELPEQAAPEPKKMSLPEPSLADRSLEEWLADQKEPTPVEWDISPAHENTEPSLRLSVPEAGSDLAAQLIEEANAAPIAEAELDVLGALETELKESQNGRIVVDPGDSIAADFDSDALAQQRAAENLERLTGEGIPDGFQSLDALLQLGGEDLEGEKAMLGSDLLFGFDEAVLRESARASLMKIGFLIEKNPELYCWLEGHTDTFGASGYNRRLSLQRANAVKNWLVKSLAIDGGRIIVIGHGADSPLVSDGDREEQALNRRVEIKMRAEVPKAETVIEPEVLTPEETAELFEETLPKPVEAEMVLPNEDFRRLPIEPNSVEIPEAIPAEPVAIPAEAVPEPVESPLPLTE